MRFLAGVAASLAFALAVIALFQGFADLAAGTTRAWMREWEKRGNVTNGMQWATALERLRLARRLNPLNADYSADLGRLMEWRSWQKPPGSENHFESRHVAGEFYLESLGKRPGWGFAWVHHAQNRLLQGRTGAEFQAALSKAIELAPWEPGVQLKVAWMGMTAWDVLSPELRDQVTSNIERAVQLDVHRHDIVRLAVQYDWLAYLVPMMRSERQIATLNIVLKQIERP